MPQAVYEDAVSTVIAQMQQDAKKRLQRNILVDGQSRSIPYPYPSPADWRDSWIYFLMLDRFNNPSTDPLSGKTNWNRKFGGRQGGNFLGVQKQLGYLERLGVRALWLSPVLKNSKPNFDFNYHGYGAQDFLTLDARFASDGTLATAEREYTELIQEAHARGIYVIQDIVFNHAARVFDYLVDNGTQVKITDGRFLNVALGQEPRIRWLNGFGYPREDWTQDLPDSSLLSPDDAVWPRDLQRKEFFRRRGSKITDNPPRDGFVIGDFDDMRQLVVEYDARPNGQEFLRQIYGQSPVLAILIRAYTYLIAKYDLDGFRIDTVKYVAPDAVATFGNAMREFALSVNKANFFTFGEIAGPDEATIQRFVGRDTGGDGFGIDAALDFSLTGVLSSIAKNKAEVEKVQNVFEERKRNEKGRISSHGEAGRYFVSFLDNHDRYERFNHFGMPEEQVTLGLAALFCLQGIPCIYYGTEQGLQGTVDGLDSFESVREALWGKPNAFDENHSLYRHLHTIAELRLDETPLRYGRLYFREVAGTNRDFGYSKGVGGLLVFSRILGDREVVFVANTAFAGNDFVGQVIVDLDLSRRSRSFRVAYSNQGTTGQSAVEVGTARFFHGSSFETGEAAFLPIRLKPMEVQILTLTT